MHWRGELLLGQFLDNEVAAVIDTRYIWLIDFRDPTAPRAVIEHAVAELGHVDALVCNQASSGRDGGLEEITAEDLDHYWVVGARAGLLLV